ncbi:MAG: RidA family protein [Candidatus Gastranaerophilales bacterium]|nr:RidA family protein [Candidatus Gastranaerophilales bacterium]
MSFIIQKIKELGLELPPAPKPVGAYIPAIRTGNLIFTSGILPVIDGKVIYTKEIGGFLNSVSRGYDAAKLCALNALSVINDIAGLDNIERIIKVTGFVNSAPSFNDQPKVINGASELLVSIFGENGKHVRSAVGVNELPLLASVELELIVQVK